MKLSQQVAEAAAVARTSTSAEQEKERHAVEIEQHLAAAKLRIADKLSKLSVWALLHGSRELVFSKHTSYPVTADAEIDDNIGSKAVPVYEVPNHFKHEEVRAALTTWLLGEGFTRVVFTQWNERNRIPEKEDRVQEIIKLHWEVDPARTSALEALKAQEDTQ